MCRQIIIGSPTHYGNPSAVRYLTNRFWLVLVAVVLAVAWVGVGVGIEVEVGVTSAFRVGV